jgi:serine/threonine-protein kinase
MIRRIELLILSGLLLIVAAITLNWALQGAIHFQKDVLVPDLTNKSVIEALGILSEQGLGLKKEGQEFNDALPAGTILRQQPAAGMLVREGKMIRVTISQGGESVFVPELVGQSLRAAEISLRYTLLTLGEVRPQPSLKYEKDVVISQEPAPKTTVSKNTFVHLAVSNGPPEDGTILMPDFSGKSRKEVLEWAKQTGVKAEMSGDASSSQSETVIQQELPADTPVDPGRTIRFMLSAQAPGTEAEGSLAPGTRKFHFEVPQGESSKEYKFVLVDSSGSREIWRGSPEPGSKLNIPLPQKLSFPARIRIFVNGILTEERNLQ